MRLVIATCWLAALALAPCVAARAQGSLPAPAALWAAYKARFIAPEGRLVDDSAANVSHSEGQGYAMVLAAFADDRATFAKLASWTDANLEVRPDGLAAWRWRPQDNPRVLDKNNATDGDLLIAWAFAEGGRRWHDDSYISRARKIALAIAARVIHPSILGPVLSPGVLGFGPDDTEDGPVVNLSYWVFPAFETLTELVPEVDWAGLRQSGLALIDAAKFGPRRLPSDWISLKYGVQPDAAHPRQFGYEVVRVPLYLAWGAPEERARIGEMLNAWAGPSDRPPPVVDIDTGSQVGTFADAGYRAVAALARCAADGAKFPEELRTVELARYYPATLHMLSLTALRLRFPQCL
jgi:endoglucanase